jgi:UDP-N-acetylmuramoyl-tripeptide--D-alanyl-D-alanine ligase
MPHTFTDIETLYKHYLECSSVATDTRNLPERCLFFALKGPNFDGNAFALEALEAGAQYAVVSDPALEGAKGCLLVKDTLRTLQELANHHRRQLQYPVIGITGSNGKTTTKELMHAVLSTRYRCHATKGNLNNHIGVPLTLLNAPKDTEIMVVEMGANQPNDIAELCDIAEPSHGLITNIGRAHLEGFGGADGVLKAKSQLYKYLIEHDGVVFVNSRQEELMNMSKRIAQPIYYPEKDGYYHCEAISANPYVKLKAENGEEVQTQLMGMYNFENIATALCVGKYFEVDAGKANKAVAEYRPSNNRSQIIEKDGNFIILDAYNANPSSMKAAIENFAALQRPHKVLILGDMFELGKDAVKEHLELGRQIARHHFEKIYLCGIQVIEILKNNPGAVHFETREMLLSYMKKKKFSNNTILIKGSRSMGLEAVVELI